MNHNQPSKDELKRLKEEFPGACRVELVSMDDPYEEMEPGTQGTVLFIDDMGTIFVEWDNGSSLGVVFGVDIIRRIW